MSTETTSEVMENGEVIKVTSLCEFIHAISDLTKGTNLYEQVITRFIENIKQPPMKLHKKAWEFYSSTFLQREAQSIFFALVNFIDKVDLIHKKKLVELYTIIRETIKTYYNSPKDILNNIPDISSHEIEFILKIINVPEDKQTSPTQVYYRGEASKNWKTIPSVLRENSYNPRESFYYHEIQVRSPKDFENLTHLNKLVTMQHFETPTRLLDLTSNPLNALYFACEDQKQMSNDGRVILFPIMPGSVSYGDSDKALILSCLPTLSSFEKHIAFGDVNDSSTDTYNDNNKSTYLNKLFLEICSEKPAFQRRIKFGDLLSPLFVQPNMINPRMVNQQGAFLLSGLTFNDDDAESKIKDHMSSTYIIIPASKKASILKELDSIGINQATIYPNLDKIAGYLKNL